MRQYESLTLSFDPDELRILRLAAERLQLTLEHYARQVILTAARDHAPRPSARQLAGLYAAARRRQHVWTVPELTARNLPLYWDDTWLPQQLAAGETYVTLAARHGYNARTLASAGARLGLDRPRVAGRAAIIAEQLAQGRGRAEIAAEQGISPERVRQLSRDAPSDTQRALTARLDALGSPITVDAVVAAYGWTRKVASTWLARLARTGHLRRVGRGVYERP